MIRKLIYRNFLLYFRDRASVFFSLLSVMIVIVLYMLFLAKFQIDSLTEEIGQFVSNSDISALVNTWILSGLLSIITITSPLGALVNIVQDKEKELIKDFHCSPLKRYKYPIASIANSIIIGFIMGLLAFVVYGLYIYITSSVTFTLMQIVKTLGLLLFSSFFGSCIMAFMVSMFKTTGAFSSASTVVGTVIGFINGLYVPIGSLPEAAAYILKVLPFGNLAMLFRKSLMSESISSIFKNAGDQAKIGYMEFYGVVFKFGDTEITTLMAILYTTAIGLIFLFIYFLNYGKKLSKK